MLPHGVWDRDQARCARRGTWLPVLTVRVRSMYKEASALEDSKRFWLFTSPDAQ